MSFHLFINDLQMTLGGEKGWRGMTHHHARIERDAFQSDALSLRGRK